MFQYTLQFNVKMKIELLTTREIAITSTTILDCYSVTLLYNNYTHEEAVNTN